MNFIIRQFCKEEHTFSSDLSAEALENKLQEFCSKRFWDFSVNLDGDKKDNGWFSFTKKYQFATSTGGGMNATLKVKVLPAVKGSVIKVVVKPNYSLVILSIVFFIAGVFALSHSFSNGTFDGNNLLLSLIFILGVPGIMTIVCYFAKDGLIDTFTNTFDLKLNDLI